MYILHAEDNDDMVELVKLVFGNLCKELTLVRVSDGAAAFHEFRLKEKIPEGQEYSAIITDYDMPHMTGAELATLIREEYGSSVPILLHTSINMSEYVYKLDIDVMVPKDQVFDLVRQTMRMLGICQDA